MNRLHNYHDCSKTRLTPGTQLTQGADFWRVFWLRRRRRNRSCSTPASCVCVNVRPLAFCVSCVPALTASAPSQRCFMTLRGRVMCACLYMLISYVVVVVVIHVLWCSSFCSLVIFAGLAAYSFLYFDKPELTLKPEVTGHYGVSVYLLAMAVVPSVLTCVGLVYISETRGGETGEGEHYWVVVTRLVEQCATSNYCAEAGCLCVIMKPVNNPLWC